MSLWKKFQRVGKKAAKFRFVITYDELHIEYDKKWIPNSVCIIWCRRNRKMKSQWRKWEPCIENSFKGIVRWPIPETLDFEVTLYRDPRDPQSFEDKEWTIFVEDRNLADTHHHSKRHQIAASADFRLNNFVGANCGLEPLETDVRLPLRPNGKRCREAIFKFKISCHFLKEGKATDEDMQSLASILISPTSATEEEGEDRPYWKKDKFNSLGRGSRPFEDPDPARHHASLNMSRDDAFFGTKISRLTRDWKATLGGQTAPLTTNNDQNNYTPSPPDSSPSPQHQLTPPVATVAPQTPVLSRANTPSSAMTIDDFNRLFLEGHRRAAMMAAVTSFSPQLELFPNTNTNNKGSSRKASFFDLEQVSNMFSKCNPPPSSIIPSSTAATSTTRMNENSKFISSPSKTQSTLPSTLALNTTSLDTATNHATKQDGGDVSHFKRFNDKLYASFRLPNTSHTKRKSPNSSGPGKNFITGPGEAQTEVNINNSIPHQQLAKFLGKTTPQNASGQMATPPANKSLTSLKFIQDSKGRLSIATIPAASAAAKNISQGATTLPRRLSSSFRRRSSKRHETNAKMKLNNTLDVLIKDEDVQQHTPSQLLKTVPPCQGDNNNNNLKTLSFAKSNKNVMPITAQNPSSYSLNSPVSTVFEWCRSVCATEYAKLKSCTEEVVTPPPPSATTNYKIVIALHRKFNFEDRNSCESDILNNNYHANLNVEKFRDGTIFCTIIEHYLPGTIDLKSLDPGDVECNNRKVYKVINDLGIVPLVEPSEMMNLTVPLDKLAIITYLYQLKTFFERRLKSSKKLPETFDEQFRTNDPRLTSVEKSLLSDVIIEQHPDIAELIEESSDYLKRNSNYFLEESPPDTSRKKGETHKKEFKIEHQPVVDIGFPIVRTLPKPFNLTASTLLTPISKALPTESLPGHSRSSPLSVLTSSYSGLAVSDPLSRHPYYPKKSASNSINYQMRPNEESGKEDLFTSVLTERGQILKQKASDLIKQARREAQLDQLRQPPIPTPPLPLELNKDKEIKEDIINIQSNDDDQDKSRESLAILDEKTTPTRVKMHNKKSNEETLLSARQIDQFPSSPSTFALHNRSFRLKIRPDFDYQYADTHLELQPSQFELFQQEQKESTMSPQQLKLIKKEERGYLKEKSMDATTNSVVFSRIVDPPLQSFSSTVQKICELNSTYYDNDQIVSDDNNNNQQLTVLKGSSKITDSGSEQGNPLNSDLSPGDEPKDGLATTKKKQNSSFPYPHADVEARLNALIDTSTDNSCLKDDLNYFISESHNLPNGEIHNYDYLLPTNITTTTTHSNRIDTLTGNLIRQEDLLNGHSGMETSSLDEHYSQVLRQQRELDEKALAMEHDLRDSMMNKESQRESVLMAEWFKIINTKNDLIHQQTQIAISAKEKDLERKYDHLKIKLQEIIDIPDKFKTKEDEAKEQELINQLVQIVDQRDQLVQKLDTEEQSLSQIDSGSRDHKNHNSKNDGRFDVHEDATRPNVGSSVSSTPPPVPVIKRHFLDRLLPSSANQSQQQQLQEPAKYLDQNFKNCDYEGDEERRGEDPFGERRSNWMFNTLVASPRNAFYNSLPRPAAAFMRSSLRTTQGWDSSVVRVKGEVATGDGKESNFPTTRHEKTADFRYDDTVPSIPISGFSTLQRGLDLPSSLRKQLKTATGSLFSSIKKS